MRVRFCPRTVDLGEHLRRAGPVGVDQPFRQFQRGGRCMRSQVIDISLKEQSFMNISKTASFATGFSGGWG